MSAEAVRGATGVATVTTTTTVEAVPPPVVTKKLSLKKKKSDRVKWDSSVKDPNPNQRTSKRCCVFHRRREFGESDTESDSDDCSSDSSHDDGAPCRCKTTFN
eukprot:RCo049320